jgi:HAD superfamily hydrolase (TIGR01509 family)
MLKAVIFDFDGVLFNSAEYYLKTRDLFFKKYNIKFTKKEHKENLATTTKDFLKYVNNKYSLDIKFKDYSLAKKEIFYSFLKEIKPNPGIISLLKELKKNKIKVVLSSSNEKENILFFLEKFDMREYFDLILSLEDIKKHKPDKEAFFKPLKILKLLPNEAVGIEDALQGVTSIHSAGIKSVAVLSKFTTKKDFLSLNPSLIVKSTKEITFKKLKSIIDNK